MSELIEQLVSALQQPRELERKPGQEPLAIIPDNMTLVDLEKFDAHPSRVRQHVSLTSIAKFTQLVNRFKNDLSIVFIAPDLKSLGSGGKPLATAIIDYHSTDKPEWGSNRICLEARPSLAYQKLMDLDNKLMDQPDFAKALEEIARFSNTHAQADLLEIAQTMRLTSKGEFKNYDDEITGSLDIRYDVAVSATAGVERKLTVPTEIGFKVSLIDGLDAVVVPVKLLYRTPAGPGQKVQMGIKIIDRTWIEEAAIAGVTQLIEDETALEAYPGTFRLGE